MPHEVRGATYFVEMFLKLVLLQKLKIKHLKLQDFKTNGEFNYALSRISSQLQLREKKTIN